MQIIQPQQRDALEACPYLPERQKQFEYFLAGHLSQQELSHVLAEGWRKFGIYYFKPACPGCRQCIPLRVPTGRFAPSRSQRRILRRNAHLRVRFAPLRFSDRAFAIYRDHSRQRFDLEPSLEDFLHGFYLPSCPGLQSEIYLDDELVAVGFLDRGTDALSSVYFCFDTRYAHLNLGTYGALQEIAYARQLGLSYYYLGYFVPGCASMAYKDLFRPRQHFDWGSQLWAEVEDSPDLGK